MWITGVFKVINRILIFLPNRNLQILLLYCKVAANCFVYFHSTFFTLPAKNCLHPSHSSFINRHFGFHPRAVFFGKKKVRSFSPTSILESPVISENPALVFLKAFLKMTCRNCFRKYSFSNPKSCLLPATCFTVQQTKKLTCF